MNKKKGNMRHSTIMDNSIQFPLLFNCIPIKHDVILTNNIVMIKPHDKKEYY